MIVVVIKVTFSDSPLKQKMLPAAINSKSRLLAITMDCLTL